MRKRQMKKNQKIMWKKLAAGCDRWERWFSPCLTPAQFREEYECQFVPSHLTVTE